MTMKYEKSRTTFCSIKNTVTVMTNLLSFRNVNIESTGISRSQEKCAFGSKSNIFVGVTITHLVIIVCHLVMTTTFSETQEGICPTVVPCFCQGDKAVSCSYQSLKELPDFLEFTEVLKELDLSENFLLVLHDNGFNGVKVKSLRLERNMIRLIEQGSFNGLSMLESLDLSHNSLTSIPSRIFKDMPVLHILRLKYNAFRTIGEESLTGLSGLHELDFTGNLFHSVPTSSLCKAPKLKKLLLRHNKIHKLKPYTFNGLSLDYLDIGANEAPLIIEPDAFCGLDPQVLSSEPGVIDYTGLSTLRLDLNGLTTLSSC